MPDEIEVETKDLQEAIQELHEERDKLEHEEKAQAWTKLIGLTTALFAVFAAVGALQAGALVNQAMISQLKASDTWNEYQATRLKTHLYNIQIDEKGTTEPAPPYLEKYKSQVEKERKKEEELKPEAEKLEKEAEHLMHRHHDFSQAVTGIQIAIALGAVAALSRSKPVWLGGSAIGLIAIGLLIKGFIG